MKLFFDPDLAASYREVASRLQRCAKHDEALVLLAAAAADRYAAELRSSAERREALWRDFLAALHAFVTLCGAGGKDAAVLRAILEENRDLLDAARPAA